MSQEAAQVPWDCDRRWVRNSSGAGYQLLGSTTDMELHHARSGFPTWGGEEEGAWVFPWGGQEGQRTSVCVGAGLCPGLEPASGLCLSLSFSSEALWDDEQLGH